MSESSESRLSEAAASPLLVSLFADGAVAAELRGAGIAEGLYPEELEELGGAIARRAGEYAAGRLSARLALAQLGIREFPLRRGEDRRPLWPQGVVGSITHTRGFGGAVAARRERYRSIGVDAERIGRVGRHLWPKICTGAECAWLDLLPPDRQDQAGAVIFSAKEAFYKCQYGVTESWVGFHDVELDPLDWGQPPGSFSVRPTVALRLAQELAPPWIGHYAVEADLVVSGMAFAA
ncbi:MAG: 4'-phosphopantetheinyl transferase superfamily protein [Nevskia sp.]|nr:4'-phosphopantetheinyl transferase superfamily protein [Nevskia sp.]